MNFGLLILLACGLVALWAWLVLFTAWLLTHPPRRSYAWAVSRGVPGDPGEVRVPARIDGETAAEGLQYSDLAITSGAVALAAWDIPGGDAAGPVFIVTPGWGDSRVVMLSRLQALWPLASRLVLYDTRGHGDSRGTCALGTKEVADLIAVIDHVRENGPDGVPIVLHGFSLGAGVSIAAAALDRSIAAVIAEAPYRIPRTPARNVLASRALPYRLTLPPAMLLVGLRHAGTASWGFSGSAGGFDRAEHAAGLPPETRLLVLHGSADIICPLEDAAAIANAGHGTLIEIPGGAHTNLWTDPALTSLCISAVQTLVTQLRTHQDINAPCPAPTPSSRLAD